ncbi:MAG: glycosyltransferase, partial [Candidatus Angelobacter sp.]
WLPQFAFCLAVLSKETAIITPAVLAGWKFFHAIDPPYGRHRFRRATIWLLPALPLLAWLGYHHKVTGRFFGSSDFYQYNVAAVISPLRFALALGLRLWHLLGIMNMAALTAATAVAMWFPPVMDAAGERQRIAVTVQLQFYLIMLAHVITFSLLGGALLTRYLLAAYPLVIIIGMSTLRRRLSSWEWPASVLIIFFVLALFFDPPYRFAPEDNLTYRDYVELHVRAASFLHRHESNQTVLTAWPATDELTKPYLGYVPARIPVVAIPDFTAGALLKAQQERSNYQVAYPFSTKYEASTWFRSKMWEQLNRRFFDYHRDLSPQAAAELLGGRVVFAEQNKAEWVGIIEFQPPPSMAHRR